MAAPARNAARILQYDMKLSFEEAAAGVNTKIRIPRLEFCDTCNGTGAKAGTGAVACDTCGGRGQIHYQQGFFTISRTCPACRGAGQTCGNVRQVAAGRAASSARRPSICEFRREWIPERVCAYRAKASPAQMAARLAIFMSCSRCRSTTFSSGETRIYSRCSDLDRAGGAGHGNFGAGAARRRTLENSRRDADGQTFRLKGKGMPDPHGGGKGDLYYAVKVITPNKLSREQRRLLQELERTLPAENRPAARNSSIFDKVKDIFG